MTSLTYFPLAFEVVFHAAIFCFVTHCSSPLRDKTKNDCLRFFFFFGGGGGGVTSPPPPPPPPPPPRNLPCLSIKYINYYEQSSQSPQLYLVKMSFLYSVFILTSDLSCQSLLLIPLEITEMRSCPLS